MHILAQCVRVCVCVCTCVRAHTTPNNTCSNSIQLNIYPTWCKWHLIDKSLHTQSDHMRLAKYMYTRTNVITHVYTQTYTQYIHAHYIHCYSHIILMLSDDMACNPRNQYPGECRELLIARHLHLLSQLRSSTMLIRTLTFMAMT